MVPDSEATREKSAKVGATRHRSKSGTFSPNRPVCVVTEEGPCDLPAAAVSAETIGWKAFGLSALPKEWVPPYFVITRNAIAIGNQNGKLNTWILTALQQIGVENGTVFVRSSGPFETLENAGRFFSEECAPLDVAATIERLTKRLASGEEVHWIVQRFIPAVRKGHLSNERQMSRESRDWVAEFELQGNRPGYSAPIGVRHWRHGERLSDFDLSCTSETGVTVKLRRVAFWGSNFPCRLHFEWIWNGTRISIVQGVAARDAVGVNPDNILQRNVPDVQVHALKHFKVAEDLHYDIYGKLRNARTYRGLGYEMPRFFVLDDQIAIGAILSGELPASLVEDLETLTVRPLIIRTDGLDIPKDKREMLPRSETLRNVEDARKWLLEKFALEIKEIGIAQCQLCLIAHHFIPSSAAAWARAEPGNRIVRIESLWGLPEGLYWYSHDTFEIDTKNAPPANAQYGFRERLRFKGTFIAPDSTGKWIPYHPKAPFDWGRSIRRQEWLSEMAWTTRRIADREEKAVTVMWFIDNHSNATKHSVLPWYHSESAIGTPKAAPRRKFKMASDFKIATLEHWKKLKSNTGRVERIILDPEDPELIRNPEFARELAEFAAEHNIVIELAGGILSHAYYILQRHGAQVECIDLFGAQEEIAEYNKLVRDKIPEQIRQKGESVQVVRLGGEALLAALRQKLVEESFEAADARGADELVAELADVQEVVKGICKALQIPGEQVTIEQDEKRKRRGGFQAGCMLQKTSLPHSLAEKKGSAIQDDLALDGSAELKLIEHSGALPASPPYRRPDLRSVGEQPEAVLTFESDLSGIRQAKEATVFELPIDDGKQSFKLSIELRRNRSVLWTQVRVKPQPLQMEMALSSESQLNFGFVDELKDSEK